MNTFAVDYRILVPEWDSTIIQADDRDDAENLARQEAQDKYPEAAEIEITRVEEQF